mmetsp:Transcript_59849/g.165556  ORF Transcript_59849/g.165556 Transcript_59849/m.165556 type:complete len:369 (+) Transcript_59849:2661-3767(+)
MRVLRHNPRLPVVREDFWRQDGGASAPTNFGQCAFACRLELADLMQLVTLTDLSRCYAVAWPPEPVGLAQLMLDPLGMLQELPVLPLEGLDVMPESRSLPEGVTFHPSAVLLNGLVLFHQVIGHGAAPAQGKVQTALPEVLNNGGIVKVPLVRIVPHEAPAELLDRGPRALVIPEPNRDFARGVVRLLFGHLPGFIGRCRGFHYLVLVPPEQRRVNLRLHCGNQAYRHTSGRGPFGHYCSSFLQLRSILGEEAARLQQGCIVLYLRGLGLKLLFVRPQNYLCVKESADGLLLCRTVVHDAHSLQLCLLLANLGSELLGTGVMLHHDELAAPHLKAAASCTPAEDLGLLLAPALAISLALEDLKASVGL